MCILRQGINLYGCMQNVFLVTGYWYIFLCVEHVSCNMLPTHIAVYRLQKTHYATCMTHVTEYKEHSVTDYSVQKVDFVTGDRYCIQKVCILWQVIDTYHCVQKETFPSLFPLCSAASSSRPTSNRSFEVSSFSQYFFFCVMMSLLFWFFYWNSF